jgi:hypothetical protein
MQSHANHLNPLGVMASPVAAARVRLPRPDNLPRRVLQRRAAAFASIRYRSGYTVDDGVASRMVGTVSASD